MMGFGNFVCKVRARLRKGAAVYGDRSFTADEKIGEDENGK